MIKKLFFTVAFFFLLAHPSKAYLDPGTGSYILQILIGFVLAAGLSFRTINAKIKSIFKKSQNKDIDKTDDKQ